MSLYFIFCHGICRDGIIVLVVACTERESVPTIPARKNIPSVLPTVYSSTRSNPPGAANLGTFFSLHLTTHKTHDRVEIVRHRKNMRIAILA